MFCGRQILERARQPAAPPTASPVATETMPAANRISDRGSQAPRPACSTPSLLTTASLLAPYRWSRISASAASGHPAGSPTARRWFQGTASRKSLSGPLALGSSVHGVIPSASTTSLSYSPSSDGRCRRAPATVRSWPASRSHRMPHLIAAQDPVSASNGRPLLGKSQSNRPSSPGRLDATKDEATRLIAFYRPSLRRGNSSTHRVQFLARSRTWSWPEGCGDRGAREGGVGTDVQASSTSRDGLPKAGGERPQQRRVCRHFCSKRKLGSSSHLDPRLECSGPMCAQAPTSTQEAPIGRTPH